jgi:hypothetical protein
LKVTIKDLRDDIKIIKMEEEEKSKRETNRKRRLNFGSKKLYEENMYWFWEKSD